MVRKTENGPVTDEMIIDYFDLLIRRANTLIAHADDPVQACCRICLRTLCHTYRRARADLVRMGALRPDGV